MPPSAMNCPNCGAPLNVDANSRLALCVYCNTTLRMQPDGSPQPGVTVIPTLTETPPEVGEKVKQMIADGRRSQAMAYYVEQAHVTPQEAEEAVNRIAIPLALKMTHQVPIDLWAVIVYPLVIIALAAGAAWALRATLDGKGWGYGLLALFLLWLGLGRTLWLAPKLVSTWVDHYGPKGRARILKMAVIRPDLVKGGTLVNVLLEVQPEEGQSFQDEQSWLIRNESLPKVQAGNVIPVRYEARTHDRVFPISPITVLEQAHDPTAEARG